MNKLKDEFINTENFKNWLERVVYKEVDESYLYESIQELVNQYDNSGLYSYELSKFETKSGVPELYSFCVYETNEKRLFIL